MSSSTAVTSNSALSNSSLAALHNNKAARHVKTDTPASNVGFGAQSLGQSTMAANAAMATPLPARRDGIGPVPPSMVAVLQSSGPRASVIEFKMEPAAKICPRTSSALEIDDWTRKLRDICGTFGLTAVIDNEMPSVADVRDCALVHLV